MDGAVVVAEKNIADLGPVTMAKMAIQPVLSPGTASEVDLKKENIGGHGRMIEPICRRIRSESEPKTSELQAGHMTMDQSHTKFHTKNATDSTQRRFEVGKHRQKY